MKTKADDGINISKFFSTCGMLKVIYFEIDQVEYDRSQISIHSNVLLSWKLYYQELNCKVSEPYC